MLTLNSLKIYSKQAKNFVAEAQKILYEGCNLSVTSIEYVDITLVFKTFPKNLCM